MDVLRAHKNWARGKAVTGTVFDATFVKEYVNDGWPSTPFKSNGTTGTVQLTGTAGLVNLVVLANHNIKPPATVALSGDIVSAMVVPALRPNGITLNIGLKLGASVSVDDITVTVTGNPTEFIIGEILMGVTESFDLLSDDNSFTYDIGAIIHDDIDVSSVPGYDLPWAARGMTGSAWATLTEKTFLEEWLEGQTGEMRPSVIIPNPGDDPWVVSLGTQISGKQRRGDPDRLYNVSATFKEFKRSRW